MYNIHTIGMLLTAIVHALPLNNFLILLPINVASVEDESKFLA